MTFAMIVATLLLSLAIDVSLPAELTVVGLKTSDLTANPLQIVTRKCNSYQAQDVTMSSAFGEWRTARTTVSLYDCITMIISPLVQGTDNVGTTLSTTLPKEVPSNLPGTIRATFGKKNVTFNRVYYWIQSQPGKFLLKEMADVNPESPDLVGDITKLRTVLEMVVLAVSRDSACIYVCTVDQRLFELEALYMLMREGKSDSGFETCEAKARAVGVPLQEGIHSLNGTQCRP